MNRKLALSLPLLALLCFAMVGQTLGQTRTCGVDVDDYFFYHMKAYWNSSNSQAIVPSDLAIWNDTMSYKITVSYVQGTNVTTEDLWSFNNGSATPSVVVQDIATGEQYLMYGLIRDNIVGANLQKGDMLFAEASDQRKINDTVIIDYGAVNRETNMVSFSYPILSDNNITIGGFGSRVDYYDKETGVLIGRNEKIVMATGETTSIVLSAVQTNRWSITDAPQFVTPEPSDEPTASGSIKLFGADISMPVLAGIIAAVVIVAVVVPIILIKTKKNKKKKYRR